MNANPRKYGTFYLHSDSVLGWICVYVSPHGAEYIHATDRDWRKAWHKATWNHRGPVNKLTFRECAA